MKIQLLPFALLISFITQAQQVLHDGNDYTEIVFQFQEPQFNSVNTGQGNAIIPILKGTVSTLENTAPHLLSASASVMIPKGAETSVEVISSEFLDRENILIAPSKGNLKRNINPAELPFVYGNVYQQNAFYPATIAAVGQKYILRGSNGLSVKVSPLQYNPVTKTLRAYSSITVRVNYTFPNNQSLQKSNTTRDMDGLFRHRFINYSQAKYNTVGERAKLLIIAPANYFTALEPYVLWKKQIGYEVEVVDYATIGSDVNLAQYIADSYHNDNTGYVLLVSDHQVGDPNHVPAFNTNYGYSDNYYAMIDGGDWYPELFMGRFSAATEAQVQTMVERVIRYEKFPQANGNWYNQAVGIGSDLGPGDNNEMDWEHERLIGQKLTGYTYAHFNELYDGTHTQNDASGNPSDIDLANLLETGLSFINYTGHGSESEIVTTGYNNLNVDMLNNTDKYPFFVSVGCVNGNFTDQTCFAEHWMRATADDGSAAGAINAFMSTINQSWDPPMSAQDEIVNILTEQYAGFSPKIFGCLANNGLMKMNDDYGPDGDEITATWVNFGDPTTMVRTAIPTPLVVNHDSVAGLGATTITFNSPNEGATVSITQNGIVLGSGVVTGGSVTITIDALATTDSLEITGFAFNTVPYLGTMSVSSTPVSVKNLPINSFQLFPNPANTFINITFSQTNDLPSEISLINSFGQELRHFSKPNKLKTTIDLEGIASGVYLVKVADANGISTKRILVEK